MPQTVVFLGNSLAGDDSAGYLRDNWKDIAPIVVSGRPLTPSQIGLLAATGLSHIEVFQAPRIGIIATGDEILPTAEDESNPAGARVEPLDGGRVKPPSNAISARA